MNQENGFTKPKRFGDHRWSPEPGDSLIGTVVGFDERIVNGQTAVVCRIADQDNQVVDVWVTGVVLINQFQNEDPQPGDRIAIRYDGIPTDKKYRMYQVVVQHADCTSIDWADVQPIQSNDSHESAA